MKRDSYPNFCFKDKVTGEEYYSSPEIDYSVELLILGIFAIASPLWIAAALWLAGAR